MRSAGENMPFFPLLFLAAPRASKGPVNNGAMLPDEELRPEAYSVI